MGKVRLVTYLSLGVRMRIESVEMTAHSRETQLGRSYFEQMCNLDVFLRRRFVYVRLYPSLLTGVLLLLWTSQN